MRHFVFNIRVKYYEKTCKTRKESYNKFFLSLMLSKKVF